MQRKSAYCGFDYAVGELAELQPPNCKNSTFDLIKFFSNCQNILVTDIFIFN